MKSLFRKVTVVAGMVFASCHLFCVKADDGHGLWLGMKPNDKPAQVQLTILQDGGGTVVPSPTAKLAYDELSRYWHGAPVTLMLQVDSKAGKDKAKDADAEGFTITRKAQGGLEVKAHGSDVGLLYGAYHLLRLQQAAMPINPTVQVPAFSLRLLNHWDNLDGSIERGYAGRSIFWKPKVASNEAIIKEYARANASIGINGTVLNNVNASPNMLTANTLQKVKAYADILRPYGIKVYLSVNFASPMKVGIKGLNNGKPLSTADPLDPTVKLWWQKKVDEIYQLIPDFGGFLVKANSEGQPGPGDFKRTHSEGANMMADALKPHGGIVMWRAFVYGYHEGATDRVMKAVNEFKPLDGLFRENVIIQIKNGPLDFQPREPYSPLFDQLSETPMMPELQITQEYLGQSRHLVYLGPMWKEFFAQLAVQPLCRQGCGTGAMPMTAIAGVANIGDDANWCGHHFSQANWYVFGRLAWNPQLTSRQVAREWLMQTFTSDERFVEPMTDVMETSHEACVDYMMPLGLHHIFKGDHHYGPEPEGNQPNFPDEWKPVWYHKAAKDGVGFDRTMATGTGATAQYRSPYKEMFENVETCPDEYLLWFHHLPWDMVMPNGLTLWQNISMHYEKGVQAVERYNATWQQMRQYVDEQRFSEVAARLAHQLENAREWRDHCTGYFKKYAE
jgi:alpha-glucuronidase